MVRRPLASPHDAAPTPTRRAFLRVAGVGAIALAAGCRPPKDEETGGAADTDTADTGEDTGADTADTATDTADTATDTATDTADTATDTGDPIPDACTVTPERGEGPYYRADAPFRTDLNPLGREGTRMRIYGHVRTADGCGPIAGALVDVWHAMPGPPDPPYDMESGDYEFRGRLLTDEHGRYAFSTIRPPSYTDDGRIVQQHLHLKVSAEGYTSVITQIVFSDDPNNRDHDDAVEVTLVEDGAGLWEAEHPVVLVPA